MSYRAAQYMLIPEMTRQQKLDAFREELADIDDRREPFDKYSDWKITQRRQEIAKGMEAA